jgi:hypothetical protein
MAARAMSAGSTSASAAVLAGASIDSVLSVDPDSRVPERRMMLSPFEG